MPRIKVEHFGGPEVLKLVDEPDPLPGDVQISIDVKAAGVNFADIAARAGRYPAVPSAPFYPGIETAGIVKEIGRGVDGLTPGDRVIGFIGTTGYATVNVIDAKSVFKIPDSLDFNVGSALLVQGLTAYFLLEHGHNGPGKTVLISSASGGLGSLAIQIAKLKGAAQVIGLASASKHERIKGLGADAAIDYTKPGWAKEVLEATGGKGVDLYLDSSGDLAGEGFDALGSASHWLIYGGQGSTGKPFLAERLGALIGKSISLRGYSVYFDVANFGKVLPELIEWAVAGKLKVDVQTFPLAEAAEAHRAIEGRKTSGKVVLIP